MTTWEEMRRDAWRAAQTLLQAGHFRSCVSRAYYAVYCSIAAELSERTIQYPKGWKNPSHDQIYRFVERMAHEGRNFAQQAKKALRRLRLGREDADYRPGVSVNRPEGLQYIKEALLVLKFMGSEHEKGPKK